ncbi:hypothetical protein [Rhizobium sp. YTU87027]|uniref:hypothetical protein n=1 Tax=Rhizobium sp. YTU87027 TaxID=3417741 RepID=UPI003D6911E0
MARYQWNDISVLAEDLIAFAWSAPLRDLAATIGISDVGLRKQMVGYGIPLPPQGYWNKVKAGKPVPSMPRPEDRRPGQTGRITVDKRFEEVIPVAQPISSKGPFSSKAVPESLDELYLQELSAIGRIAVPKSLERPHPGLMRLLRAEEKRRMKFAANRWSYDAPRFDTPLANRQLRFMSALFSALSNRGHDGWVRENDGQFDITIQIGDTHIGVEIAISGKVGRRPPQRLTKDLPVTTPLTLYLRPGFDRVISKSWSDDREGKLEDKIASIAASLIVAGEARFRELLREHEAWDERRRTEEEKARLKRIEEMNLARLNNLKTSGELLRQAQDIRALVDRVRLAMLESAVEIDPSALTDWERWALSEADKLDPVLSGQFLSHLHVSSDEE